MNPAVAGRKKTAAGRVARALALGCTAVFAATLAAPSAQALTINTYTSGFTSAELALINNAVNFYQTTFSDAITVDIGIQAIGSGLGQSQTYVGVTSYSSYRTLLAADATSSDDATALASLPLTASGGITPNVTMKLATARAVGFNAPAGPSSSLFCNAIPGLPANIDSCIGINTSLTTATPFTPGKYYFLTVLEHEMDEVLGTGSDLSTGGIFTGNMSVEDLFRYNAPGSREWARYACDANFRGPTAYLSLDGGNTNLANFNNCNNNGDYGDYVYQDVPAQVQDAFGTPGGGLFLTSSSTEIRDLDALGYTRAAAVVATPEPASLVLLATGFAGIAGVARRRKVAAK